MVGHGHSSALVSSLREPPVQSYPVQQRLIDHGFASSVVDINVSVLPEISGHVYQTGYTITGLVSAATLWDRSYVEFTMTCCGFCALRQPVLQVSGVPFRAPLNHKTSSHAYFCVFSVPRHSSQGTITLGQCSLTSTRLSQHCENHRCRAAQSSRAEAEVTGATSIAANLACGRRRVHQHSLSTVFVRKFFSRASSLRLRGSEPSDWIFPPATWAY